jgi:hypothetical protein
MPRITVTSDAAPDDGAAVLLDERIGSAELAEDPQAMQFIERIGWAINDAEDAERPSEHQPVRAPSRATPTSPGLRVARLRGRNTRRRIA